MKKLILPLTKKGTLYLSIGIIFLVLQVFVNTLQPFLLSILTNAFQSLNQQNTQEILLYSLKYFAIIIITILVGLVFKLISRIHLVKLGYEITQKLRYKLYHRISNISEKEISKISLPSFSNRLLNDSYQFQETVIMTVFSGFEVTLSFILTIVFCIILSPILSNVFWFILIISIVAFYITDKKANKLYNEANLESDVINKIISENILGHRVVKSFNLYDEQKKLFDKSNSKWTKSITKGENTVYLVYLILLFVLNFFSVLVVVLGGVILYNDLGINVGIIIAFLNYLYSSIFDIFTLSEIVIGYNRIKPIIKRLNEILDSKKEFEKENLSFDSSFVPTIEFKNVFFKYLDDSHEYDLENISFKIPQHKTIGIIGPTGSGKTTILNLLTKLWEPNKGNIVISNIDISEISTSEVRDKIAIATQDKNIFSGTIKSNILMGKTNANNEEIMKAIKLSKLDDLVSSSEKLNMEIKQYGSNLSGGQKQRLSLARTLIKDHEILILDDTLSALDNLTRNEIIKNLKKEFKNKTIIIVSQQIKTVSWVDEIILLDNGKISGIGKHETLLKNNKLYKEIYNSQKSIGE